MMREELYTALSVGVPSVEGRVFPLTMPQDTNKSCVVYKILSNYDTTGISCTQPINTRFFVQVDVLAKTYAESASLMEEVKQVLRDNFLAFGITSYEDYLNITLKYRQIIDCQLELKN